MVETGDGVENVRQGDRVLVSCISACGRCRYCRGMYRQCQSGGGWILGHLVDGTQAELTHPVRRQQPLQGARGLSDEQVLFLSDILPTGFEVGVLNGNVRPGDVVAVVGAGPVGLAAMMTARLYGPSRVVAIDKADSRLEKARAVRRGCDRQPRRRRPGRGRHGPDRRARRRRGHRGGGHPPDLRALHRPGAPGRPRRQRRRPRPPRHLETLWIRNITITTGLVDTRSTTLLRLVSRAASTRSPSPPTASPSTR